jgi:hypothetical protein
MQMQLFAMRVKIFSLVVVTWEIFGPDGIFGILGEIIDF